MGQPSNVAPFKKSDSAAPAAKPRRKFLRQNELVDLVKSYQPDADEDELNKAYVYAVMKHGQQLRHSGDPYFAHPVAVAGLLTEIRMDQSTIIAGLLHDVVEDCNVPVSEIRDMFGPEVADLVDGVTKLPKQREGQAIPRAVQQAENFQKFILATTKDIRVPAREAGRSPAQHAHDRVHADRGIAPASLARNTRHLCASGSPRGSVDIRGRAGRSRLPASEPDRTLRYRQASRRTGVRRHVCSRSHPLGP